MKRRRFEREPEPQEKRRPTLADRFITRTFSERERAVHPKTIDQLKAGIRNARRFVFDDDASRRLGEIITTVPELLIREHQFARAPYDLTWIEFSGWALWEVFRQQRPEIYEMLGKYGDPDTADHTVGYLIDHERVNVICGGTVSDPDASAEILPVQYRLHTPITPELEANFIRRVDLRPPEDVEMYLWGSTWEHLSEATRAAVRGRNTVEFLPGNPLHFNYDRWLNSRVWREAMRGSVGELRNVIALLLVLNRPSLTRYIRTLPNGRGFHKGKLKSFMAHTTVAIDLDAVPTLRLIGTPAEDAVAKRRGEVKGHYKHDETSRQYSRIAGCIHEYQPTHGPKDNWAPWPDAPIGMVGEPGIPRNWVCAACGGKRWWRRETEAGDAGVGFVNHDAYQVTS